MKRGLRVIVLALVVIAIFFFGAGFVGFVRAAKNFETVDFSGYPSVDGVVVLTGGQDRIAKGVDVLASGRGKRLLISGVNPNTSAAELAHGVPKFKDFADCCIDLGYEAQNTIGNAEETRDWARQNQFQSLIIVTSSYHMPRALAELHHALPGTELIPHVVVSDGQRGSAAAFSADDLRLYFVEYVKFLAAQLRFLFVPEGGLSSNGATKAAWGWRQNGFGMGAFSPTFLPEGQFEVYSI